LGSGGHLSFRGQRLQVSSANHVTLEHYALEEARINLNNEVQRTRLVRLAGKVQLFDAGKYELPARIRNLKGTFCSQSVGATLPEVRTYQHRRAEPAGQPH